MTKEKNETNRCQEKDTIEIQLISTQPKWQKHGRYPKDHCNLRHATTDGVSGHDPR